MNQPYQYLRLALAALLAAGLSANVALAGTVSYSIRVSENLSVLRNPSNSNVAMMAALQTSHQLLVDRNMPYFELLNLSDTAEITSLSLTIGDTSSNFDFAAFIEASPGVNFAVTQGDSAPGGIKTDVLHLSFTGLGPNEFVRFRTDIDADVGSALSDYRQVLFDLNGGNTSDNSIVTVNFDDPGFPDATLTGPLQDFSGPAAAQPLISQQLIRACATAPSPVVVSFGQTQTGEQFVPEPGTNALLAIGGLGMLVMFRRNRRSGRSCPPADRAAA